MTARSVKKPVYFLQCRDESHWQIERLLRIGASDAAAALGCSPWKSGYSLGHEMLLAINHGQVDPLDSERLFWGSTFEPVIRKVVADRLGCRIYHKPWRIHRNHTLTHMQASLDGIIVGNVKRIEAIAKEHGIDFPSPAGKGVLEVKTSSEFASYQWKEEWPVHYQVQCQHSLAVTGFNWGIVAVLHGFNRLEIYPFVRHESFIEAMIAAERIFFANIEEGVVPAPDDMESTRETIRKLYRHEEPGTEIELSAEAVLWDAELIKLKENQSADQKKITALENKIINEIGNHSAGVLPDGSKYTYRTQRRKEYTVAAKEFRALRKSKAKETK